jgi:vitamin B12 transporter
MPPLSRNCDVQRNRPLCHCLRRREGVGVGMCRGAKSGDPLGSLRKSLFRGKEHSMFIRSSISCAPQPGLLDSIATAHVKKPPLNSSWSRLIGIVIALILIATSSSAATERGRVEGDVTDPSGARMAGAYVTLRDATGAAFYQSRTDADGHFLITDVAEGHYVVKVDAPGFSQSQVVKIDLRPGATETVNIRLDVATISDQLVITATRTETATSELGSSISVVTNDDLKRANNTLVSESLRLIPGLVVAQTGGRGGLTSIFARGGESDYNKVLIDGVPVNAAGGLFDFSSLTPENLERIEVVRGPRSALFGSDAMTSVIQLVTRRGSTSVPELELSGEGGSFDFQRETARLSGLAGWFDYSASFGFQATDGRFRNNDFTNRSASANLGFRLSENAQLRITSRWNNNTLGVPGPTGILFADPDERQKHRDLALAAGLDLKISARVNQTARFIYSEFDTHNFDPAGQDLTKPDTPLLPPFAFFPDSAFTFRDHQKRAGFQYQAIAVITSSNVLTGGVEFEHESGVFTDEFSRVSPARNNLGLFIQDQASWRGRLFLTAGVRVERNTGSVPDDLRAALLALGSSAPVGEVGFGVEANPKLAATFVARRHRDRDALGATRLNASFGTGIKEARLLEAFSPNSFFLGNPALDPERATSFDVGISQELFNRRASLDVAYFDNRFKDLIVFTSDPLTFGPVMLGDGRLTNFINVERASARGFELEGAARPLHKLRVMASYTFLRSRLERALDQVSREIGLALLRRPRHSGAVEVSFIAERFDARLEGSFVGKRRDFDPVTFARFDLANRPIFNDGYAKLNAAGSFRLTRFVTAFARLENLLNQNYEEILGFPSYRLNFSAGLRIRVGGGR